VISDARLLEVARQVFLEHGIAATTHEVARRAGIAEGTLFRRFPSKAELFRAAMQFDPEQALAFVESLPCLAGTADLRSALVGFCTQFLEIGRVAIRVMMLSWSSPEANAQCVRDRGVRHRRLIEAFTAFFDAERRLGRCEVGDPEIPARMLIGSLHQYCFSELMLAGECRLEPAAFVDSVVDLLLRAVSHGAGDKAPAQDALTPHRNP
jgi:AcrR family transcriptional regulator